MQLVLSRIMSPSCTPNMLRLNEQTNREKKCKLFDKRNVWQEKKNYHVFEVHWARAESVVNMLFFIDLNRIESPQICCQSFDFNANKSHCAHAVIVYSWTVSLKLYMGSTLSNSCRAAFRLFLQRIFKLSSSTKKAHMKRNVKQTIQCEIQRYLGTYFVEDIINKMWRSTK